MEILSIVSAIFELIQMHLIGLKIKWGFVFGLLSCFGWLTYTFFTGSAFGILVICPVCIFLNIRNFILWSKDEEDTQAYDI